MEQSRCMKQDSERGGRGRKDNAKEYYVVFFFSFQPETESVVWSLKVSLSVLGKEITT